MFKKHTQFFCFIILFYLISCQQEESGAKKIDQASLAPQTRLNGSSSANEGILNQPLLNMSADKSAFLSPCARSLPMKQAIMNEINSFQDKLFSFKWGQFFSDKNCSEVTEEDLAQIESLDLSGQNLTDDQLKPEDFSGLKFVKKYDLTDNFLTRLPEGLGPAVEFIECFNNQIRFLPPDLSQRFPFLISFNCGDNPIENLSKIKWPKTLKLIALPASQLRNFPLDWHEQKIDLQHVNIQQNHFPKKQEERIKKALSQMGITVII